MGTIHDFQSFVAEFFFAEHEVVRPDAIRENRFRK